MNEPQLSAEMEKRLKKKLAEELHIDWAFKNVHGKPDTIIITGTPKGSYETDYNLFVENMTHFLATALEEQKKEILSEVDRWLWDDEGEEAIRADERKKVLEEVVDELVIWIRSQWITVEELKHKGCGNHNGNNECCRNETLELVRTKLNQLKGKHE